jgi:hypothetical protein
MTGTASHGLGNLHPDGINGERLSSPPASRWKIDPLHTWTTQIFPSHIEMKIPPGNVTDIVVLMAQILFTVTCHLDRQHHLPRRSTSDWSQRGLVRRKDTRLYFLVMLSLTNLTGGCMQDHITDRMIGSNTTRNLCFVCPLVFKPLGAESSILGE